MQFKLSIRVVTETRTTVLKSKRTELILMTNQTIKFTLRGICLVLIALVVVSGPAAAQTTDEDKTLSPYFFVQGDPKTDRLPLKDTTVDIVVSGVIADVTVRQTYRNEGSNPINARYVFPASTRAA